MSSHPKFSAFDTIKTSYKNVQNHGIDAYILVPKSAKSGSHPVIVRFHGGSLILGAALYADWFPQYFIDYALQHDAIIVAPNYRLMPESNGLDILEDISDFWAWLRTDLMSTLQASYPSVTPDLNHVLSAGESAGGYLAVQSAIIQPRGSIHASFATYPMLDLRADHYSKAYSKTIFGAPMLPESKLEEYLVQVKHGDVVTEISPDTKDRAAFNLMSLQQGRISGYLGSDESLYPLESVLKAQSLPYAFLLHGIDDSAVPVEGSKKYVKIVEEEFGEGSIDLFTGPGDHGFDTDFTLETPGVREGLEKVKNAWLS